MGRQTVKLLSIRPAKQHAEPSAVVQEPCPRILRTDSMTNLALRWLLLALLALTSLPSAAQSQRPLPHPVPTPPSFERAIEQGTRTSRGEPGPRYWQQRADYTLRAALDTTAKRLSGDAVIRYQNNSPDTLGVVVLKLRQNLHREGVPRTRSVEVTGGIDVQNVRVDGFAVTDAGRSNAAGTYTVDGTQLYLRPRLPILPGGETTISMDWGFRIPEAGAPRMGQDGEVYYLGYWYPQVAVYDDVVGWDTDAYLGLGEHYMGYGDYDVRITVPEGFLVGATGVLQNPDEVLRDEVLDRLRVAATSDEPVAVVPASDLGRATADAPDGTLTWHFTAENVRDFAFGTSDAYTWDATRANVGDRDGDGTDDFAAIHTLYRPGTTAWDRSANYARFSIEHLSTTLFPYPYPHMTAVEGLIGGGMEYPMITLIGGARSPQGLFGVTYHEIAHMWFPMIVGQDEADFAWMDEGLASFLTNAGTDAFYGAEANAWDPRRQAHYYLAGSGRAVPPMRHGDQYPPGPARGVASYSTPAVLLRALEGIAGSARFAEAFRAYGERWAYKHPYPDDLFNTFEDVLDEDFDWLWTPTLFDTWTVDLAIVAVEQDADGVIVRVADLGLAPMPASVVVTYTDGRTERRTIPVTTWLKGHTDTEVVFPPGEVARVEIDPEVYLPDVDRTNNVWSIEEAPLPGTGG